MGRIREILLAEYIGAVAIGLILAQAVMNFIATIVNGVTAYWEIQRAGSVLSGGRTFSWTAPITSLTDVALYLLVAFLMIRWLYLGEGTDDDIRVDNEAEAAEQT